MSDNHSAAQDADPPKQEASEKEPAGLFYYRIRFRQEGQEFTVASQYENLVYGDQVIIKSDHGPEPAFIVARAAGATGEDLERPVSFKVVRKANREERDKFSRLPGLEQEAFAICSRQVENLQLPMNLVRVERFFNGSKIIFYFTAESRVDFRELVKLLVQEFRTRVEMRQIGVRHETQMTGGLGACGRELCCTSFLKKFESVSIKMAKTQDLPLNPAKISGVCNRLLCCLTYEYDSYRRMKKGMPRVGRFIQYEDTLYRVTRQIPLLGNLAAVTNEGEERIFSEEEWRAAKQVQKSSGRKGQGKKGGSGKRTQQGD